MSEQLRHHGEKHENLNHDNHEQQEAIRKSVESKAEKSKNEHAENLGEIRSKIETEAKSKKEKSEHHKDKHESDKPVFVNKELKNLAYQRTLRRTQSKLSAPSRAFSKVIHQPTVENVSEFAGKTIARPSGILMGGISAFIGSSIFLWAARYYGYEYNFLLFALFFVGGFFIGLFVELGLHLANRKTKQ